MQIWDLRTGGIFETLEYDHAVTALQFDTRKIVAATGENGVKVRGSSFMCEVLACTEPPCRSITAQLCNIRV